MPVVYQDVTEFRLMPMKYLWLHAVNGDEVKLDNLSADSDYTIAKVTKRDGKGAERLIGYLVTITAIHIGTNVQELNATMEQFRTLEANAFVRFEPNAGAYGRTGSLWLPVGCGVTWTVGKAEQRPQLAVTVTRQIKSLDKDLASGVNIFTID